MFQMLRLAAAMIDDLGFSELRDRSWLDAHSQNLHLDQRSLADLACACLSSM